jgi:hypothetical protein
MRYSLEPGSQTHLLRYRDFPHKNEEWKAAFQEYKDFIAHHVQNGVMYKDIGAALGLSASAVGYAAYSYAFKPGERRRHKPGEPYQAKGVSLPWVPPPRSQS